MANQPSKYSKFLVGAASAALVASAVAPVASAADFKDTKGNTHEEAINALSDSGVIKGYSDGTFLPNKTLTRSDVVKMMGKWLVTEGATIPADARTNPRFTDLTTKSNAELLDYAAVVKDAGVFIGSNGKLLAVDNITRENMALVLVRAFDQVNDFDLVTYVNAQEFKKDVKDLSAAKKEAQDAINVLDFFDITNPTVSTFNPKGNTTRGHFATFLHKSINTDFSLVSGVVTGAVKAINATTVEVTFKEKVENVGDFTIEGLTVSNAAVKQTDDKVVVLTTAVQEGGKKYTVSHAGKEIGSFEGLSAVIPTKIDITTQSVQGKVGAQAILSADVGVKQAGIPVTFNVKADTTTTLNKDQVFEAVTNADGIATFSYTQYAAGTDSVVAYPTGAPAVRSLGYVFWGVDTILAIEDVTKEVTVNNGANKTYKVKYLDPKTGKAVAGKRFAVSFKENINVNVNQLSNAKVNNVNPTQLLNGTAPKVAVIITDAKGEATFTVTGENTAVTPIVFEQAFTSNTANATVYSEEYKSDVLQATASKVTFGAIQADYKIELKRDGLEEAAKGLANGREYNIVVKDKDGKVAKNETVNVAFNEDLDGVISTQTAAQFIKEDAADNPFYAGKQITVVTNDKGEASFVIGSEVLNSYATPVAWIDVNSAYANEGKLDKGEATIVGEISYFADAKLAGAALTTYNEAGKKTKEIDASQSAEFRVALTNQSGKSIKLADVGYSNIQASFTVHNTGANIIEVAGQKVSPNRSHTVPAANADSIVVKSVDGKSTSVRVVANGVAKANSTGVLDYNFTSSETTATFTASTDVADLHTGVVSSYHSGNKTLKFAGKDAVKYAGATGYTYKYFGGNGAQLSTADAFITELTKGGTAVVTYKVDADKLVTFNIVSIDTSVGATGKPVDTNTPAAGTVTGTLTISGAGTIDASVPGTSATFTLGDADLNINPAQIDTATIAVKDTAGKSLNLTLNETGINTNVFTTVLTEGTLKTLAAGTITATYVDAKNAAGVQQTITATTTLKTASGVLGAGTFTQATAVTPATAAVLTIPSFDPTKQFGTGQTVDVAIDAIPAVTVDLDGKTGATGVAAAINAAITGATATVSGNSVIITTDSTNGVTSTITVTPANVSEIIAATKTGVAENAAATKAKYAFTIATVLAAGEKVVIGSESYALTTATLNDQAAELVAAINANTASAFTAVNTGSPSAAVTLTAKAAGTITAPVVTVK